MLFPLPNVSAAPAAAPSLVLIADIGIGLACLSVLAVLATVLLRRRDLFDARSGWLLAVVILASGAAHATDAVGGVASVDAAIPQLAMAMLALGAAAALWPRVPRLLALASPRVLARELQERRAAEARVAQFLAHVPDALFVLRVTEVGMLWAEVVNPAFERVFGVTAAAAAPPRLPPLLAAHVARRWRDVAASGRAEESELTAELPGGRRQWQIVLVPIRGPNGQVERLLGSARDVTATRRLQEDLVQSARLATVGTMCAGLTHEASQPLNAAALWLRRLRAAGRALPEAEHAAFARAAQLVEVQLRRAGDLLQRIRTLAGEEPRDVAVFDLLGAVGAALRLVAPQFAAEAITLRLEQDGAPLPVRGSPSRLQQAILQLLSNARDAVQERRLRDPLAPASIQLALRSTAGVVAIEVRDTGRGVPETLAGRIFDPFFTTKEPGRGSGLGLPLAAGIARAMGGGLVTWNLPGGGACFRLELAAAEPAARRHADVPALA